MGDIVIIGGSDQGECTLDLIERAGVDRAVGFLDDRQPAGSTIAGLPVLGGVGEAASLRADGRFDALVVAIGDNHRRRLVVESVRAADPNVVFATLVDPSATIAGDVTLGEGTVVMAGAVVNRGASTGAHVLLCVRSSLDHHSTMASFSSLAPAAATGGRVTIGAETAVGIGAAIIHGTTIGAHVVIGAGAAVVHDLGDELVATGVPARARRPRTIGEPYL